LSVENRNVTENHVIVGEMMEANSSMQKDAMSPGRGISDVSWPVDPDVARATGGYSLSFALAVIQVFVCRGAAKHLYDIICSR
jgi:hypothetical protein